MTGTAAQVAGLRGETRRLEQMDGRVNIARSTPSLSGGNPPGAVGPV